jgi:uncharacterized protein YdaU (DUF1376 family)|tara:strand:- start:349 stop:1164 length:816 start_codon:yes stop_codon:yes gene_type:complete
MHYYKKNIGDYHKKAGRLSMLQHGSYTLLIDSCYDRERFPTIEEAIDWTWASSVEEIEAVKFVLNKFFILEDGVYIQNRIEEELNDYHQKALTNKRIAQERETNRKGNDTKRVRSVYESPPNHKPLTINQEPLTNINTKTVKTFQPLARLMSLQVSEQIAKDWLAIRKAKRKPLTETALTRIINQAQKGGYTLQAALTISCEEGWAGFGHDWKTNNSLNNDEPKVVKIAWYSSEEATTKKGIEIGCPRLPGDDTGSYRERIQKQLSGESND